MTHKYILLLTSLSALILGCGVCIAGNGRILGNDMNMTVTSVKVGGYVGGRIDDCSAIA